MLVAKSATISIPYFSVRAERVRSAFLYSRFCFRIRCIFCVAALRGDARNEEKKN